MNYMSAGSAPALNYGKQNESRAHNLYQQNTEKHCNCFMLEKTGLHVRSHIHFIGVSPGTLIECKCQWKGLL